MAQQERGCAYRIQGRGRGCSGKRAEDEMVPGAAGAGPGEAFEGGAEVDGHEGGVIGVPEEDEVAEGRPS